MGQKRNLKLNSFVGYAYLIPEGGREGGTLDYSLNLAISKIQQILK